MCLYPKLIKNRKYISNKKNGGNPPPVYDKRVLAVPVGCGKCMECMKQKASNWRVRLLEEVRTNKNGIFVTLTFSNESITKLTKEIKSYGYEKDNEIATLAVRRFLERWRKKYKKSVRHWLITEIGHQGTENIHLHGIIWTDKPKEEITDIWKYGYTWLGEYVNERTVNYIIKYVTKIDEQHKYFTGKILTSNGIGKGYLQRTDKNKNRYKQGETKETYTNKQGYKIALPTYYRNSIYNEEEKEKLWIEKLDKQERYVGGEKVDISKGLEKYYKARDYYRKKNARLGYGNDEKNWKQQEYEQQQRELMYEKRTDNDRLPRGQTSQTQ